jgi:DNA-binding transcriptional MerR regulator
VTEQLGFADNKDPGALRTIGEVATALGIRQHVLRYWEQKFPMLRPLQRSGGRRYYRPEDVALVATIDRLINREGYTLKGARQAIERGVSGDAISSTAVEQAELDDTVPDGPGEMASGSDILPQLRVIRQRLAAALAA